MFFLKESSARFYIQSTFDKHLRKFHGVVRTWGYNEYHECIHGWTVVFFPKKVGN